MKKEDFSDIASLRFYSQTELSFKVPFVSQEKEILYSNISGMEGHGRNIDIVPLSANLSKKSKDSRSGSYFQVEISFRIEKKEGDTLLNDLKNSSNHFIATDLSGNRVLIRSDSDGYSFSSTSDGAYENVTINVDSPSGYQYIL